VLNWGLGHATRCMPIIKDLMEKGHPVILASDGRAAQLLQKEFPKLTIEILPAYNVTYQSSNMIWSIAPQIPKILRAIFLEKKIMNRLLQKHNVDVLISDNRFGCYSNNIKSIFITHQINIQTPFGWLSKIVNFFNHAFIKKYEECWVPDFEGKKSLAGDLAQNHDLKNIQYIGAQTRFSAMSISQKYDVIIVLSGPEPQRTYLEEKLLMQAKSLLEYRFLIVQGKTEEVKITTPFPNVEMHSFMTAQALNEAICASEIVIARSGYSTVMDLSILNKKVIFIPTPGQTEQEYLAKRFFDRKIALVQTQESVDLEKALVEIVDFLPFS